MKLLEYKNNQLSINNITQLIEKMFNINKKRRKTICIDITTAKKVINIKKICNLRK